MIHKFGDVKVCTEPHCKSGFKLNCYYTKDNQPYFLIGEGIANFACKTCRDNIAEERFGYFYIIVPKTSLIIGRTNTEEYKLNINNENLRFMPKALTTYTNNYQKDYIHLTD